MDIHLHLHLFPFLLASLEILDLWENYQPACGICCCLLSLVFVHFYSALWFNPEIIYEVALWQTKESSKRNVVHHHISSSEQLLQATMRWPELSCKILIKLIHFDLKMAPFIYLSGHPSPSRQNQLIKLHWNIKQRLMKSLQCCCFGFISTVHAK